MAVVVPTPSAGQKIPAASYGAQVAAAIADLYTVVTDTTIGTIATGFVTAAGGQTARTAIDGKLVFLNINLNRSGAALTATAGNITDTLCFTLDAPYRPAETVAFAWGGNVTGLGFIDSTSGQCVLQSASDTLATSSDIRFTVTFLLP